MVMVMVIWYGDGGGEGDCENDGGGDGYGHAWCMMTMTVVVTMTMAVLVVHQGMVASSQIKQGVEKLQTDAASEHRDDDRLASAAARSLPRAGATLGDILPVTWNSCSGQSTLPPQPGRGTAYSL